MDERQADDARRGDDVPQDGLGRDAAHGGEQDARYQGGSVGRSSGRAGDDDLQGEHGTRGTRGTGGAGERAGAAEQGDGREAGVRPQGRGDDDDGPGPYDSAPPNAPRSAGVPQEGDEVGGGAEDTATAAGALDGLDLAERDDVRRRDPTTH